MFYFLFPGPILSSTKTLLQILFWICLKQLHTFQRQDSVQTLKCEATPRLHLPAPTPQAELVYHIMLCVSFQLDCEIVSARAVSCRIKSTACCCRPCKYFVSWTNYLIESPCAKGAYISDCIKYSVAWTYAISPIHMQNTWCQARVLNSSISQKMGGNALNVRGAWVILVFEVGSISPLHKMAPGWSQNLFPFFPYIN